MPAKIIPGVVRGAMRALNEMGRSLCPPIFVAGSAVADIQGRRFEKSLQTRTLGAWQFRK